MMNMKRILFLLVCIVLLGACSKTQEQKMEAHITKGVKAALGFPDTYEPLGFSPYYLLGARQEDNDKLLGGMPFYATEDPALKIYFTLDQVMDEHSSSSREELDRAITVSDSIVKANNFQPFMYALSHTFRYKEEDGSLRTKTLYFMVDSTKTAIKQARRFVE